MLVIFKYCSRSDPEVCTLSLELTDVFAELSSEIDALQADQLSIFAVRQALESITNWIESLGICISLLDIAFSTIQKFSKTNKKSKKKKSGDGVQFKDSEQVICGITDKLSSFRTSLDDSLKQLHSFTEKSTANISLSVFKLQFASKLEVSTFSC